MIILSGRTKPYFPKYDNIDRYTTQQRSLQYNLLIKSFPPGLWSQIYGLCRVQYLEFTKYFSNSNEVSQYSKFTTDKKYEDDLLANTSGPEIFRMCYNSNFSKENIILTSQTLQDFIYHKTQTLLTSYKIIWIFISQKTCVNLVVF